MLHYNHMHDSQQRILELAADHNLATMSLREIGEKAGIGTNPQLTRHHLKQLEKNGFLKLDKKSGQMLLASQLNETQDSNLIYIPIMGQANCGQAVSFADDQVEGYLPVSASLIKRSTKKPYALRAVGDSMTDAKIPTFGGNIAGIEEGDYVVIDAEDTAAANNDYIVSVIDGLANIKRLKVDDFGMRLVSESKQPYPPITIDPQEQSYFVGGKVLAVVKP